DGGCEKEKVFRGFQKASHQRQVVRLASSRSEYELFGVAPDLRGHLLASLLQEGASLPTGLVAGGRIAPTRHPTIHGFQSRGMEGGGRIVIYINHLNYYQIVESS